LGAADSALARRLRDADDAEREGHEHSLLALPVMLFGKNDRLYGVSY